MKTSNAFLKELYEKTKDAEVEKLQLSIQINFSKKVSTLIDNDIISKDDVISFCKENNISQPEFLKFLEAKKTEVTRGGC